MKTGNGKPNVIVVGAGPSGIAVAHALRIGLGFDNFMVSHLLTSRNCSMSRVYLMLISHHRCTRKILESEVRGNRILIQDGKSLLCDLYTVIFRLTRYCSGCDVPTQLYSFSWNQKPDWPADLCDQEQILECG